MYLRLSYPSHPVAGTMSAGLASEVFVRTVRARCLFCAGAFFLLSCRDSSYIRYISHGEGEYGVLTLKLIAISSYVIGV